MKDSGIEWIGEIPQDWYVVPIRSAFLEVKNKNIDGKITNALQFKYGTIIRKNNFNVDDDYVADTILNYNIVEPNTIMINCLNLNYDFVSLRVAIVKETGVITSAYLAIKPDEQTVYPMYANYLFKAYDNCKAFHNMGIGVRKTLSFNELKCKKMLLPSMKKQIEIVSEINSKCYEIETVIEKIKETIDEYKKLKQSVISEAVTKGIRPDREMKGSGIEWVGEIPKEWVSTIIKRYCNLKTGSTPSTNNQEWFNGSLEWYTPCDFNEQYYLRNSARKLSQKARKDDVVCIVPKNTVMIIGIGGTAGKIGITTTECSFNQQITALINNKKLLSKYLMYWLIANNKILLETALYTTLPIINNETIGEYPLIIPNEILEQQEITDYLDKKCAEIDALIAKKEQLVTELENYKKSLIYEYVTGKMEVI